MAASLRVPALVIAVAAVVGACSRGADETRVTTDLQERLNRDVKPGLFQVVSLRREGSSPMPASAAGAARVLVYFNTTLKLNQDYTFGGWDQLSPPSVAFALGANEKGIFGLEAENKAGDTIRAYGTTIEGAIKDSPAALAPLKLHYLRWVLFDIGKETYFMYQGIFDTDFDKYTEDAVALFISLGVNTVFENLEGFPMDWKSNVPAFVKFVRDHQRPSFLEYGEYPYVTADEVKKALRLKRAFSEALDQMQ